MRKIFISLLVLATIVGCGNRKKKSSSNKEASKTTITGAGATFPLPFYNLAFKTYGNESNPVSYGGIGSGGGIRSLKDKIVDFCGSDAYLGEAEMKTMPDVLHIPTCMGAVVIALNIPNISTLNITGEIIADIYLGKITKWNDKSIASINPNVKLPNKKIIPVYRSDGSGTTFVFSYYLSQISKDWDKTVGKGKSLKWPTGIASKGNPGVIGTISQTPYSFGYVGSEYAFMTKVPTANVKNKSGKFITPSISSISASAKSELPNDMRAMITNSSAIDAYPISCFTWIILYKEQNYNDRSVEQAKSTLNLIKWVINDGQKLAEKVNYAPIPESAKEKATNLLKEVTYNGKKIYE